MTDKTKRQLRAEAVERLKKLEASGESYFPSDILERVTPSKKAGIDELIDLLTDDEPKSLVETNWRKLLGNPCRATDFFIDNCSGDCYCCPLPLHVCNWNYDEGIQRARIFTWLMSRDEEKESV